MFNSKGGQNIDPFSKFYVQTYTFASDDAARIENNPKIVLESANIHVYTNDIYYGNASDSSNAVIRANAVVWFENLRPFDLLFKNYTAGANGKVVIVGTIKEA